MNKPNNIASITMKELKEKFTGGSVYPHNGSLTQPEQSDWKCYLFDESDTGISWTWTPNKGQEPNWFRRKMQYLILGHRWVKG